MELSLNGLDHVLRLLCTLPLDQPDVWRQAHQQVQHPLQQFRKRLQAELTGAPEAPPLADALREEVLHAEDLMGWRVFLEWELAQGLPSLGTVQAAAVAQLPEPQGAWALYRDLALAPNVPEWEVLCQARLSHKGVPLQALLQGLPPRRRTLRQLLLPLRHLDLHPQDLLDELVLLKQNGGVRGTLSRTLFRQLKRPLQRQVLRKEYRQHLLETSFLCAVEGAPHTFPETPEWHLLKQHRDQVFEDLQERQLQAGPWRFWLRYRSDFQAHLPVLRTFLEGVSSRSLLSLNISPEVRLLLEPWRHEPVVWSLLILGTSGSLKRQLLFQRPSPPAPNALLSSVRKHLQQQLLGAGEASRSAPAPQALPTAQQLRASQQWLQDLQAAGLLKEVLTRAVLQKALRDPYRSAAFLRNWNRWSPRFPDLPQLQAPSALSWTLRGTTQDLPALRKQRPSGVSAAEWLEPWRLKRLLRGGPKHQALLGRALLALREHLGEASPEWQERFRSLSPELLQIWRQQLPRTHWTVTEWALLLPRPDFWTHPQVLEELKTFPFSAWGKSDLPLPPQLLEFIDAHPDLLRHAFEQDPPNFLKPYQRQAPWWKLIPQVVARGTLCSEFADAVRPADLPQALEALQDHYGPNQLAALELAVHFGLAFAPFLLALAQKLALGRDDQVQGDECNRWYRTYPLPKRSGGTRIITAPHPTLKRFQRAVLDQELNTWELHDAATGFRPGIGIVENARRHCGQALVVNVDIKGFFPNTRFPQVLKLLRQRLSGRFRPRAIRLLATLLSYEQALPTGAPTSPALANQLLRSTDAALTTVATRRGVTYTRYADDLTFSSSGRGAVEILPFVEERLRDQGYELDPKKTNLFRRGRRQCVTGLVVNEKPNWAKPLRRKLRAAVHHRVQGRPVFWHGRPLEDQPLLGLIHFLAQTQPQEAQALQAQLQAAGVHP